MKRKKVKKVLKNNLKVALDVLKDDPSQKEYYYGARDAIFSVMEDLGISCKNSPHSMKKRRKKKHGGR